jgi:hypothetical protein
MENQEILIRKARRGRDFTTIPNETIRDPRLSMDTLGILVSIISLPEDWVIRKIDLEKRLRVGRRILDRAFNEMKSAGYLFEMEVVSNSTKFSGKGYLVYADSDASADVQNVQWGEPADVQNVQREMTITDVQNVHLQKKQYNTTKETLIPPLSPNGGNVRIDYKGLDKAVEAWLTYKAEKKQKYKSYKAIQTMVNKLYKFSKGNPERAIEIVEFSMAMNYQGFFEPRENNFAAAPQKQMPPRKSKVKYYDTDFPDRIRTATREEYNLLVSGNPDSTYVITQEYFD